MTRQRGQSGRDYDLYIAIRKSKILIRKSVTTTNQSSMSLCLLDIKDALTKNVVRWITSSDSVPSGRGMRQLIIYFKITYKFNNIYQNLS